jgi:hypothetical protein
MARTALHPGSPWDSLPGRLLLGVCLGACTPAVDAAGPESSSGEVLDPTGASVGTGGTSSPSSSESSASSNTGSEGVDSSAGDPACCGCLCGDPRWSCTENTCLDDQGSALALVPEAGFFEITGGTFEVGGQVYPAPTERIFYSFHPADEDPAARPLLVFFNGGPGASTAHLLGLNTGPFTLDPQAGGGPVVNAASWTQFANLLYIDAPSTGLSYTLPMPSGQTPDVGTEVNRDAATFVRVVLGFSARHPQLDASSVVLVGQSFGGTRATMMLHHLLFHDELVEGDFVDAALRDEIVAYLDRVDGRGSYPPERVAERFSAVMIQPSLACALQRDLGPGPFGGGCSPSDLYQCDEPVGTVDELTATLAVSLEQPTALATVFGVDPTTIAWLYADQRTSAYGRTPKAGDDEQAMVAVFGELADDDQYYLPFNDAFFWAPNLELPDACERSDGRHFLRVAAFVPIFITNAEFDRIVYSPNIPLALASHDDVVSAVVLDTGVPADAERPGTMRIDYVDGTRRDLRFPSYPGAGHSVTWRAAAELREDIEAWL